MSVDVLISPRISFSHDLRETEHEYSVPIETLDTGFDFDFAFIVDSHGALIRETSPADELFSDGKLLPISIDLAPNTEIVQSTSPVFPCFEEEENKTEEKKKTIKSLKEHLQDSIDAEEEEEKPHSPPKKPLSQPSAIRGFWNFRRSNSLNSSNYGRNRAKLNVPSKLRLLSRSKSTGEGVSWLSAKSVKEEDEEEVEANPGSDLNKSYQNRGGIIESLKFILHGSNSTGEVFSKRKLQSTHELRKEKQFGIRRSCSLNCDGNNGGRGLFIGRSNSTGSASNLKQIGINNGKKEFQRQNSAKYPSCNAKVTTSKKEKRRRSFKEYYGNSYRSERVNSVLNLPSPYISRVSVDFLGFGSLFCNSKSRKGKK